MRPRYLRGRRPPINIQMRHSADHHWDDLFATCRSSTTLSSILTVAMTGERRGGRDQCWGIGRCTQMSQTTSSWKQWVSLFFVWLFLYSLAFINGLWPFIKFAESEATLQCLSKLWSLIHSSEQNWNSFCLGLIDVKTPCQEYPDSQKHNPPEPATAPVWTAADIDWPWTEEWHGDRNEGPVMSLPQ